jgi:hypothetical protein
MRLFSRKAFALAVISALACRDTSGPSAVAAQFVLNDINGRPLPTYFAPTPGLTPTIVSGTLVLDKTGHAQMTEHRIEWNGADATTNRNYTYKITDDHIEFALLDQCVMPEGCPLLGTVSTNGLSLQMGHLGSEFILYNYRIATAF